MEAPAAACTGELDAVADDRLVTDQRGVLLETLPVVVLLTFKTRETTAVLRVVARCARLLSAGDDGCLRLWDAASGALLCLCVHVSFCPLPA